MELSHRSDHELLSDVTNLVGTHREITAKLVQYLAEIEERRLHLKSGFPSMFAFCVRQLGLGETEAFRRIVAARLGRRFPVVFSLLASGRVHLTTLELLRERLTEDNHRELLEAVAGKGKREVEATLAALFPRPDVLSSIRQLPKPPSMPPPRTSLRDRAMCLSTSAERPTPYPFREARTKASERGDFFAAFAAIPRG